MRVRAAHIVVLAAVLGACAAPADPDSTMNAVVLRTTSGVISLRTDQNRYSQGDTARLILRNESVENVEYSLCGASREIFLGDRWRPIESTRACFAIGLVLAPGQEAVYPEPISSEWEPGSYRLVTEVSRPTRMDQGEKVATPRFFVTR